MRAKVKGINLLPKEYIQAEKVKMIQMIVGGVVILEVFAFIGGVALPPKIEAKQVQAELDEVSLKLNDSRFADVNKTIQELETAKVEVEEWVTKYGDIKKENFISSRVLDSLTARLPFGMAIDKIEIKPEGEASSGKEIVIEGSANSIEAIINYVTVIESVYGTGTVSYEGFANEELGVYKYKLDVKIPVKVEVTPETTTPPSDGTTETPIDESNTQPTEQTEGGANE